MLTAVAPAADPARASHVSTRGRSHDVTHVGCEWREEREGREERAPARSRPSEESEPSPVAERQKEGEDAWVGDAEEEGLVKGEDGGCVRRKRREQRGGA